MPTLYDNFSQVRQYIDQGKPDLASYVTKTELANCGYLTSIPSEYITQQELSTNSYATTTYVSNNYLSLHGDRLMDGTLILGNAVPVILGSERSWKIYEGETGSKAYIALQANVDAKSFFIRDKYNNNIIQVYNSNTAGNYVKNYNLNTYTCSIVPNTDNSYTIGSHTLSKYFQSAYTHRVYLGNQISLADDSNNGSTFAIYQGGVGHYSFEQASFHPYGTTYGGNIDLGTSTRTWRSTYTNNLYLNGTNIIDTINGIFSYDSSTGTLTITTI